PRHLWTGDWRHASQENDESLPTQPLRPPEEDPLAEPAAVTEPLPTETSERRRRMRGAPFAIGLAIAILAAAGLFATSLIGGGSNNDNQNSDNATALPSVGSKPIQPRKG